MSVSGSINFNEKISPGRLPVDGPVHGSISRTPDVYARWAKNALSHASHLYSDVRIAAPRDRQLLHLSRTNVASCLTDHRLGADHDRAGAFYHWVLLRTESARSPRPTLKDRNNNYGSRWSTARGERRERKLSDCQFSIADGNKLVIGNRKLAITLTIVA